jgi:hypothetical protein
MRAHLKQNQGKNKEFQKLQKRIPVLIRKLPKSPQINTNRIAFINNIIY